MWQSKWLQHECVPLLTSGAQAVSTQLRRWHQATLWSQVAWHNLVDWNLQISELEPNTIQQHQLKNWCINSSKDWVYFNYVTIWDLTFPMLDGFISSLDPCFDNQKVVGRGDLAIGQTATKLTRSTQVERGKSLPSRKFFSPTLYLYFKGNVSYS